MIQIPYWVYTAVLSDLEIKKLLDHHDSQEKIKGIHYSDGSGGNSIRDSLITFLPSQNYANIFAPYANNANSAAQWGWNITLMESLQISTYESGQYYDWHVDGFVDTASARKIVASKSVTGTDQAVDPSLAGTIRKLSLVVQLSDPSEYDGGDFMIQCPAHDREAIDLSVDKFKPKGSIIVFPSFVRHKVTPVTRGKRHSMTTWFGGPPYV
jgi:PKHD-type hydroxylase